jgi:hypothetical protein
MATELFNTWCANHQHRAIQLLSDMRAMGLAVESLAEVEQFTKIRFSPPGDIDGIFPQDLFDSSMQCSRSTIMSAAFFGRAVAAPIAAPDLLNSF